MCRGNGRSPALQVVLFFTRTHTACSTGAPLTLAFNTAPRAASKDQRMQTLRMHRRTEAPGFTLIELMVVVLVVAILAAIAHPAYTQYLFRARALPGTDALAASSVRLEQRFQDVGGYGVGAAGTDDSACGVTLATPPNFAVTCASLDGGTRFLVTASGSGPVEGLVYTIDDNGVRRTLAHPRGVPPADCWSLKGSTCDS